MFTADTGVAISPVIRRGLVVFLGRPLPLRGGIWVASSASAVGGGVLTFFGRPLLLGSGSSSDALVDGGEAKSSTFLGRPLFFR